ncbi:MAG: hypothetical protein RLZZ118_1545 [Bacteroidota bacterium]|jgi:hypothetical protein
MKKYLFAIITFLFVINANAQFYINHFSLEGQGQDPTVFDYDLLPNGNTIVTAIVDTTAIFNPNNMTLYQESVVKNPGSIVTCISPSNTVLWTKKWLPENYMNDFMYIYQTIHDAAGNIYLGARYVGKVDIDPGTAIQYFQPKSTNSGEACIIKLDSNGQFIWAKKIGDTTGYNTIYINQMQWLPNGNISLIGNFNGMLDFDPSTNINTLNTGSPYTRHGYSLELDAAGNFIQVKQLSGNYASLQYMYTDNASNHYVIYYYDDTVNVSFSASNNLKIATANFGNYGFAKFDANYNLMWDKNIDTNIYPTCITPIDNNVFYLMSNYSATATLNNGIITQAIGASDICIDKWKAAGNVAWTKTIAGKGENTGLDLQLINSCLYLIHLNKDSTNFTSGYPSAIYTNNTNMAFSALDTALQHISTAVFYSDSANNTWTSKLLLNGNQSLIKMYVKGPIDLDPTPSAQTFTPAFGNNNPAVFVRVNIANPSAINNCKAVNNLEIYPNPANQQISIHLQENDYQISIVNAWGQKVFEKQYKANNTEIDVRHLPPGLYQILLFADKYKANTSFLKQ